MFERLSAFLQPHKYAVAKSAEVVTILQMFSGVTMCHGIWKARKSDEFPFMPFLAGAVFSLINLQYGVIVKDPTITNVSFVGFILSSLYSCFYVFYTSKQGKQAVWNKLSIGAAITAASIAYAKYEDPAHLEFRFGILMTVFLFAMVAAPLLDLGDIIRNKSVGQMPFAMTLIGGVVGALWLLYSIILNNSLMIVQNLVMTTLTLFQLALFAIYPNKTPVAIKSEDQKSAAEGKPAKSRKSKKAD